MGCKLWERQLLPSTDILKTFNNRVTYILKYETYQQEGLIFLLS